MLRTPFASSAIAITAAMSITLSGLSPVSAEETTGMGGQELTQAEAQPQHSPEEVREILAQELTEEELALIDEYFATPPESEVGTQALPVVVVAAAAWCARGALASVPTTALTDLINGQNSGWKNYAMNAAVGCLVGEVGGVAWRVIPQAAKDAAIRAVFTYYLSIRGPE
ncbi:hypothetical protein HNR06_002676 [Nocardiopsis arvandica]|uniref:Uncharacterized protein n=1 Tax=Nocardiopsis sinuspersici TaxID=501010 RepID=A0A7Z0BL19_9ACTN|nr:hypothetical protein [Nocardiopsis sinuspersici]NYH53087.1 hypothetical protein [Nocardiopsis sinuspersici]